VAFVLGDDLAASEGAYPISWYASEFEKGFLIETEAWGPMFMSESDEDLELIARESGAK
jgi:hypothetical protein